LNALKQPMKVIIATVPAGTNDVLGLVFYRVAFGGDLNAIGSSSALATCMFLFVFVMALFLRYGLTRLEERVS
jgi:raffinose/stachyose/melibiose transport system permease protein